MHFIKIYTKLLKIVLAPLAVLMALLMTFTSNIFYKPGVMDMPIVPSDFTPVLRFTVASDVHLKDEGGEAEAERLGLMLRTGHALAESSYPYNKLDAVAFAGDMTDHGSPTQLQQFKDICDANLKQPTKNLVVLGNHEFSYDTPNTVANFENIVGLPAQFNTVINGIHFIGVIPDRGGHEYSVPTQIWLYKQLKAAVAENPNKPIFVFQHHHPYDTVYGSQTWGCKDLNAVLSQFPQVIDFSGHTHFPLNDPASIWQGGFTALGTASLSYFSMEYVPFGEDQYPPGYRNAAQMYVVEVDAGGATKIRGYDLLADQFVGETYYIATPADKTSFAYNTKNRRDKSENPTFAGSAKVTAAKTTDGHYTLHFPAATSNLIVRQYEIVVNKQWGGIAYKGSHFSGYFYTPMPTDYLIDIGSLESGKTYTATVVASDAFYQLSKPLKLTFMAE